MTFYLLMFGIVVVLGLVLWARSAPRSADLGVGPGGHLAPCGDASNCVSSMAVQDDQFMAPWPYTGSTEEAHARLSLILRLLPDVEVVADEETYLAAEFRVAQVFIDDVEFLIDPTNRVVQFRSASRIGKFDFGVNRKRMQRIGEAFQASLESPSRPNPSIEPQVDPQPGTPVPGTEPGNVPAAIDSNDVETRL